MSRISACFERLAARRGKGLVTFISAGDPEPNATPALMHALVRGGADIIELGVPFSDPMADGPVIQRASERALAAGTSLDDVYRCVAKFREQDQTTPVVLMGYLNPFEHVGAASFAERAHSAGVDGVLVVDLPPEEAQDFNRVVKAAGVDQVFLVAPNTSSERVKMICNYASGFVYFVAVKGVTGDKAVDVELINARIAETRRLASLPVGIGFGIRTPQSAAASAASADAIIVGSALVEIIEQHGKHIDAAASALEIFVRSLRDAIDGKAHAA
ncbi:MAG: tryptophan synthase subunit alpha [Proteobacteria bacterium]|nr:tryptophan synthase subunit alpha [Pseudomonadota bacterium]